MKKFLIGQLASFGDCLYATTVAKQIKNDYPGSHITWAIAKRYKSILELNPYVDEIWEIELIQNDYYDIGWTNFENEAIRRKDEGIYDELVFTQLAKKHWGKYDGTIRSSTLRGYNRPITVSVDPVIKLSEDEINNVLSFARRHKLGDFKEVILFEYSPGSGQSFITEKSAEKIVLDITASFPDVCFVLSGPKPFSIANSRVIDASELSFRENAELTKYCTLLIGCSSGITWLSTSEWAKKLPTVQLLNKNYQFFAGVKYDLEYWNLSTDSVIEITRDEIDHINYCIKTIFTKNFATAKQLFDEIYRPDYFNFKNVLSIVLTMNNDRVWPGLSVVKGYFQRNKHLKLSRLLAIYFREVCKIYKKKLTTAALEVIQK